MNYAFDIQIQALRRKFIERAAKDGATLVEFLSRLDAGKSSTRIEQVVRIAHGLSGAAGTFGFPVVSRRASEFLDLVTAGAGEMQLIHACRSLVVELQRISSPGIVPGSLRLTPKTDPPTAELKVETTISEREPAATHPPVRMTVLLIATVQEFVLLANTISGFGFNVVSGSVEPSLTAPEGIVAVVVSDRVEGWMIASRVLSQSAPMLLISDDLGFHGRLAASRVGISGVIAHPFDSFELADWLDDIAGKANEPTLTVLIIEDDGLLAENYALVLRRAGMIVEVALEAAEGLDRIVSSRPDIVLLDFQLPGVNGIDLARIVRQSRRDLWLPIVFLSAERDPTLRLEARKQGGDDFVTKPVDPQDLVSVVRLRAERARALRSLMERDGLTGLLNHARLNDRLASELERCRRTGAEVTFAMFDLDRFKQVNDLYGHQSGDKVLRTLAQTLTAGLRRIDVVSRYGGEEFCVILLDTNPKAAFAVLDRLRQSFSEILFSSDDKKFNVTFSCGIASSNIHAKPEDLVRAADEALYTAKSYGRNCIAILDDEVEMQVRSPGEVLDLQGRLSVDTQAPPDGGISHDALTGLRMRTSFVNNLEMAVVSTNFDPSRKVGVLVFDIDRLKETNVAHGYPAGDKVLQNVADALRWIAADGRQALARLEGDKFAIVMLDIATPADAVREGEAILAAVRKPVPFSDTLLSHSISGGLAIFPERSADGAKLMRDAEVALDVAKAAGSGGLVLYSRGMEKDQRKHLDQLTDARTALAAGRIVPFYQPKVSLSTNTVCGFEALLRLADTLGVRPPGSIANALDHPDIGLNIGRAIQSQVFADMKAWRDANLRFGSVAINASPVELLQSAYAHDLLERLHFHSLSPESVQVEVTETAMMGDGSGKIAGELRTLMSSGVMVYLDDFGTGFSSLKHLREFPVKGLKIDRSFVRDVESDAHARAIVRALVQLANSLDLSVVGEGVETQAQAQYLSDEGCTVVQGFLYGKAMPAELVTKLLASKVFERSDH